MRILAMSAVAALAFLVVGCGDDSSSNPDGGFVRDGGFIPDSGPDAGLVPDAGGSRRCFYPTDCDDANDCTIDDCNTTTLLCEHRVTPALCAAGESCNPAIGCETGRACAIDADCTDADACTTNERCDPSLRVCTYLPLDGDSDGDPPRVCGGNDCNDGDPLVHTGVPDMCHDMIDSNCDGVVEACTFTNLGDGTVRDDGTRLIWQQVSPSSTYTQTEAVAYCEHLSVGTAWRLPMIEELVSLVDRRFSPTIDLISFPGTPSDMDSRSMFWSSTVVSGTRDGWYVWFADGSSNFQSDATALRARCVHN